MHVLFVTPEVTPYSSSGDLGEWAGALPRALHDLGVRMTVVSPLYRAVDPDRFGLARRIRKLHIPIAGETAEVGIVEGKFVDRDLSVLFVDHPPSFARDGLYGGAQGPFPDNHRRFFLFARAALALVPELGLGIDVVHANDWQTGLVPFFMRHAAPLGLGKAQALFTVHDANFAGLFDPAILDELRVGYDQFTPAGIEFHGRVSLLKAGIVSSHRVTTLSPRYARELLTPEHGSGLHGVFAALGDRLHGILPGIDGASWNPATDHRLPERYTAENLGGKEACKRALQTELRLPVRPQVPLLAVVGPLSEATGAHLALQAARELGDLMVQLAFLGPASADLAGPLADLAGARPQSLAFAPEWAGDSLRRALAGADGLLLAARSEPGGLLQLKALRYGTAPIVHAVGGLADTVVDLDSRTRTGTGFSFQTLDAGALAAAVRRATVAHADRPVWTELVRNAMRQSYTWETAAKRQVEIYQLLLA
jgi:starch synthase